MVVGLANNEYRGDGLSVRLVRDKGEQKGPKRTSKNSFFSAILAKLVVQREGYIMKEKEVSLIYVFGPQALFQDYLRGYKIEWLKIGKHNCTLHDDKWKSAVVCVNNRAHTGIPVRCRIYEVFSFPFRTGDYDDVFRRILTQEMFNLENSRALNKLISDPFEIKAGEEFVYNVSRDQIINARKNFEHSLVIETLRNKQNPDLLDKLLLENQINPFDVDDTDMVAPTSNVRKSGKCGNPDPLMEKLYNSLPNEYQRITTLNRGERYRYIIIRSARKGFWYTASYSIRSRQTSVAFETYGGIGERDTLQQFISENAISISGLTMRQGTKNLNKGSWEIVGSLDQGENEILQWFLSNIMILYQTFK